MALGHVIDAAWLDWPQSVGTEEFRENLEKEFVQRNFTGILAKAACISNSEIFFWNSNSEIFGTRNNKFAVNSPVNFPWVHLAIIWPIGGYRLDSGSKRALQAFVEEGKEEDDDMKLPKPSQLESGPQASVSAYDNHSRGGEIL
jgi:hypothetical protein